ncbi:MAG TPA: DNA translocase FtsK 4TM domain-containing protein [Nitrospirota bacterium]
MANRRVQAVKGETGGRRHEVTGILLIGASLIVGVALASYSQLDHAWGSAGSVLVPGTAPQTHNLIGPFGAYLSDFLFQLTGGGAFLLPLFMAVSGIGRLARKEREHRFLKFFGAFVLIVSLSTFLRLRYEYLSFGGIRSGGLIGELTAPVIIDKFGRVGAYILATTFLLAGLAVSTTFSILSIISGFGSRSGTALEQLKTLYLKYSERRRKSKVKESRADIEPEAPPEIVEQPVRRQAAQPQPERMQEALPFRGPDKEYTLPPMALLAEPPKDRKRPSKESLIMNSSILEKKLRDFGVEGKVVQVHPGPVVTMYEFEPAPGVKVNKISTLQDDLALAMRAESVRIVAPLPGKAAVGVEIPNNVREEVFLKEILNSGEFGKAKSHLTLALGKDIYGLPSVSDLGKMPHLLVAGATGSGKSVAINTMVMSLLMSARPRELRFVMVDPKRLELSVYDGIPHLLEPVITEPRKASLSLRKVVVVMEERYKLLAAKGVRNIDGFNTKIVEERRHPRLGGDGEDQVPPREAVINDDGTLPYIVVVIDELADLMMVAAKEIEDSIARLAQMARASGIHLIIATQRPSVDVLTGVIKANFPARISFQVSSKIDSRTILDANGAEALLGKGDMLFVPPGMSKLTRVHGSYVSEQEIHEVVQYLKKQGGPKYDTFSDITPPSFDSKKGGSSSGEDNDGRDARYNEAIDLVVNAGKASASLLQRRMRVGYPTAARMIEMMEEDGIVGPKREGGKEREVLLRPNGL